MYVQVWYVQIINYIIKYCLLLLLLQICIQLLLDHLQYFQNHYLLKLFYFCILKYINIF